MKLAIIPARDSGCFDRLVVSTDDAAPLILPRHRVQDIDTPEDWERAQLMFSALRQQSNS